jgi:dynein heavy chain
METQAIEVLK